MTPPQRRSRLQYRAVCDTDGWKGTWTTDQNQAYSDANAHRALPGNATHATKVETKQTGQ